MRYVNFNVEKRNCFLFNIWECQTEPETSRKFKKLANSLNIKLMTESKKSVLDSAKSISHGKSFQIEPIDLTLLSLP